MPLRDLTTGAQSGVIVKQQRHLISFVDWQHAQVGLKRVVQLSQLSLDEPAQCQVTRLYLTA